MAGSVAGAERRSAGLFTQEQSALLAAQLDGFLSLCLLVNGGAREATVARRGVRWAPVALTALAILSSTALASDLSPLTAHLCLRSKLVFSSASRRVTHAHSVFVCADVQCIAPHASRLVAPHQTNAIRCFVPSRKRQTTLLALIKTLFGESEFTNQ